MIPWWLNPWAEVRDLRRRINRKVRAFWNEHDRALKAEAQLRTIKRQRSEAVRKGNLTKAANRRAKQDQITEKLRAEVTA